MKKTLETEDYSIELMIDMEHDVNSTDNVYSYDDIFFELSEHQFPTQIGITLSKDGEKTKSVIIGSVGGGTGIHDHSQDITENRLTVCCSDSIFCLSIPELKLLWKTQCDMISCFSIHKYKEDFIIHGEMEISRINKNGQLMWQNSGSDIFVTPECKNDFIINDTHIIATDWNHNKYKFDFDGNLVE